VLTLSIQLIAHRLSQVGWAFKVSEWDFMHKTLPFIGIKSYPANVKTPAFWEHFA
jgi:hypothetical protein